MSVAGIKPVLSLQDLLTSSGKYPNRPKLYPPAKEYIANGLLLIERVTRMWTSYDSGPGPSKDLFVNSGWRPPAINAKTDGAAAKSWHQLLAALDIRDAVAPVAGRDEFGHLGRWAVDNIDLLEHFGLWIEDPSQTPGWLHCQIFPPPSGKRIFKVR
jgi:hypothetical protein